MARYLRSCALVGVGILCLSLTACGWVVYKGYFQYRGKVSQFMAEIPTAESKPPESFRRAVDIVHPDGVRQITIMRLYAVVRPEPERHLRYTARMILWSFLWPVLFTPEEELSIYAHSLVFEAGEGLTAASTFYFGKEPAALTDEESLSLVVMSVSPRRNSMRLHPDRFREEMQAYRAGRRRTRG